MKGSRMIAFSTTSAVMSIALFTGEKIIAEYRSNGKRYNSEELMPALRTMVTKERWKGRPDILSVDIGPGSFTGIRIGLATARACAQAWNIPLIGVTALDALAKGVGLKNGWICCMIDALRDEVFTARYRISEGKTVRVDDYRLVSIHRMIKDLREEKKIWFCVGSGALRHADLLHNELKKTATINRSFDHVPRASAVGFTALIRPGNGVRYHYSSIKPFYLRRPAPEERRLAKSGRSW